MREPWTVVTTEVVTGERLREVIDEMGMLADQSPDWVTVAEIAPPVTVPADAVITEAVFEGGRLTLKWHRLGDIALGEGTDEQRRFDAEAAEDRWGEDSDARP